jgi:NADH:ubiquinone oxidoreductase subunit 6 (subunit J)
MLLESILFWVLAVLSVSAALGVVFHRSIVYSALFLITVFLSIAGVFVLNNADFLAVAQTVVYGVGLTIVILFGIMFTGDKLFQDGAVTKRQLAAYLLVGLMTFGVLLPAAMFAYNVMPTPPMLVAILSAKGSTELLGATIFNYYALPFELASVLLLGAMVGAILISKKSFTADDVARLKYALGPSRISQDTQEDMVAGYNSLPEGPAPVYKTVADLPSNKLADDDSDVTADESSSVEEPAEVK